MIAQDVVDALRRAWEDPGEHDRQTTAVGPEAAQRLFDAATASPDPVPLERYVRHLAGCLEREVDLDAQLRTLHLGDLHWALACGLGQGAAIERLLRDFARDIDAALAKASAIVDAAELRQLATVRLLAPSEGRPPRILGYRGSGPLRGWIRMACSRLAIDLLRAGGGEPAGSGEPQVVAHLQAEVDDPELALLRGRYDEDVRAAFESAFAELDERSRQLLHRHLVRAWTTTQLGAMFGVHRTTAARWLEQAQSRVLELARQDLRRRLGTATVTAFEILALVRSGLHLSAERLLGSDDR